MHRPGPFVLLVGLAGQVAPDDALELEHVSPIGWDNVLLYGQSLLDRGLVQPRVRPHLLMICSVNWAYSRTHEFLEFVSSRSACFVSPASRTPANRLESSTLS